MANRRSNSSAFQLPQNDTCQSSRHPAYHGIQCRGGKWVSQIREPNKTSYMWLGSYPTPEMAAAAYDVAALALKGTYAVLNFPESALSNLLPESPTDDDIRAAAARAAAARAPGGRDTAPPPADVYIDDEAMFGMPNLLSDMAQGMLLSPPRIDYNYSPLDVDGTCYYGGGNLWNY